MGGDYNVFTRTEVYDTIGLKVPACSSPPAHKLSVGQVVQEWVNHDKDVDGDKHENDEDDEMGHIPQSH